MLVNGQDYINMVTYCQCRLHEHPYVARQNSGTSEKGMWIQNWPKFCATPASNDFGAPPPPPVDFDQVFELRKTK